MNDYKTKGGQVCELCDDWPDTYDVVDNWPGVAVRVLGFEVEPVAVFYCPDCGYHAVERDGGGGYVLDEGESSRTGCDCEHEGAAWNEEPEYERTERVIVVMVGDDAWHAVDADALRLIEEEDYCPECGQVGCKAYG